MSRAAPDPVDASQAPGAPADGFVEEAAGGLPPWVEAAFPWAASFLLHLGFFLLLAFTLFAVNRATKEEAIEQIVIPTATVDPDAGTAGGIPNPGSGGDPTRDVAQDKMRDVVRTDGWASHESKTSVSSVLAGDASDSVADAIYAGGGATVGGQGKGGSGQGDGGVVAPFGVPGGGTGGAGPKSNFYGTGGGATKIVYILDNSGSMIDVFDYLRKDVKKSVNNLFPIQQFGVIVFSEEAVVIANMTRATNESKRELGAKIDTVVAQGQNDYTLAPYKDAFVKAFAMKPQLIYFLTDGAFDPKLLEELKALNKDKKVRINTIAFLSSAENAEFLTLYEQLAAMAKENGGKFRKVTEKDMVGE